MYFFSAVEFGVSFECVENVLTLTVVMVVELCKNTNYYSIAHFKLINCMEYELYLSKAVIC